MSQTLVGGQVLTLLRGLSGVRTVESVIGEPEELTGGSDSYPRAYIEISEALPTPITFKQTLMGYQVTITIVLGPESMHKQDAQAALLPLSTQMRAAFTSDGTLAGNCMNSDLSQGFTNLSAYQDAQVKPTVTWQLDVQEIETTASSAP